MVMGARTFIGAGRIANFGARGTTAQAISGRTPSPVDPTVISRRISAAIYRRARGRPDMDHRVEAGDRIGGRRQVRLPAWRVATSSGFARLVAARELL
jgi:hypothetical protein